LQFNATSDICRLKFDIMKAFSLLIAASALLLSSCVSNKKYSELELEVERLRSTEAVLASVSQQQNIPIDPNGEHDNPEVEDLRRQLEDFLKEMDRLKIELEARGASEMSPEELNRYEMDKLHAHEEEMMKMHQSGEGTGMKDSEKAISEQFRKLNLINKAAKAAMQDYGNNEVTVDEKGNYVVITIKQSRLLSSDKMSLSASGETFINRLKPVLEIARGSELRINGIADNSEERITSFNAASILDTELQKMSTYNTFSAPVMVADCDNALSGRKSNCEKVEIVFGPEIEEALQLMRMGR
jgi:flagellar motor protein MotB